MPSSPDTPPEPRNPSKAALLALAVASGEPLGKAARRLGIGERTAKGWNRNPKFRAKVAELRSALVSEAIGKLSSEASEAVAVLGRIIRSRKSSDVAKLAAARAILDKLPMMSEYFDLTERVRALEERAGRDR
jgi:hypothetical protein